MKSDFFVIAFHVAAKNRWLKNNKTKIKKKISQIAKLKGNLNIN